jgi:hypothetical protein
MNALIVAAVYVFTPVVIPGATSVSIWGINDKGQAVVQTDIGSTPNGVYQGGTFAPLPSAGSGVQLSAFGINNAGVVVGGATTTSDPNEKGFILTGSVYQFFSRPGFVITEARAIGNSGLVTGMSWNFDQSGNPIYAGFVYDASTNTFTDATPPGAIGFVVMQGINKSGVISGSGNQRGIGGCAFTWQMGIFSNGKSAAVPFLDRIRIAGGFARARGINDAGLIAGFTADATNSMSVGFVGNSVRGFQLLTAPGATPDNGGTICEGINNWAQVTCGVTEAVGPTAGNSHAFIGSPSEDDEQ